MTIAFYQEISQKSAKIGGNEIWVLNFFLTHEVDIGTLDDFVMLTVVDGRIVYSANSDADLMVKF